ncbi:glycoside hydrolase family 6 protein [uncultured Amnibacterium sp.]|uniref:glycoside hydrolase family 6 protein n=1 Tax=uncultured Amnibacterium sp. TaxID=1631851 RepID=UPI0035CA29FE
MATQPCSSSVVVAPRASTARRLLSAAVALQGRAAGYGADRRGTRRRTVGRRPSRPAVRWAAASVVAALTSALLVAGAPAAQAADLGRYGAAFDRSPSAVGSLGGSGAGDAALRAKLTSSPVADWYGDWNTAVGADVAQRVDAAAARGGVAVLVTYDIPRRDCSTGSGARSAAQYRSWIRDFASGLAADRAIVVVEPDALALEGCLSAAGRAQREALLRYAVARIGATGSWVYLDAGHAGWQTPATMAGRLRRAGIVHAAGFSLNVANYRPTTDSLTYGTALSGLTRGTHFVIDTGRNGGRTAPGDWCNAAGAGLGQQPTTHTASALADAYLWIKPPGYSDGTCHGGPPAGQWYPDAARSLARHAAF